MTSVARESPAVIRDERGGDEAGIRRVHQAAFPTDLESRLVDMLRQSGRLTISLVALAGEEIVGHIAFSPVTVEQNAHGLGLAPVAVLPAFQRRGIGAALCQTGLGACRQSGVGFVVVLGDPAYYHRFGFLPARQWKLKDEYGGGEAFQAIEVHTGAIPAAGGLVKYAPEFKAFVE